MPKGLPLRVISRAIGFQEAQNAREEGRGWSGDDAAFQAQLDKFIWYPDH